MFTFRIKFEKESKKVMMMEEKLELVKEVFVVCLVVVVEK